MNNIKEKFLVALGILMLLIIGVILCVTVRQENLCWDNDYYMPINYGGEMYCFGKYEEPIAILMSKLAKD